ncbi:MAG: phosphate acyltransferase PlsX [Fibrobacteres bacterium]|nr:phosphate acyltransferase PlsX [Fibrobacterota bacterium]
MIRIALDAMGGDLGPREAVQGAIQALKQAPGPMAVVLTGDEPVLRDLIAQCGGAGLPLEVVHTTQIVEMSDTPTVALKTKPDSSLTVCVGLQKKGLVQASVSPGNTGAMMAASLMILGRAGKVSRPTVATVLPTATNKVVMVDSGANVDEKPIQLMQFAVCGSIYSKHVLGVENPRVGLLNMGEEDHKGTEVVAETYKLLKASHLNFVGNVEGHDIPKGGIDVLVTPGFTGNVVLKLYEGMGEYMAHTFKHALSGPHFDAIFETWNYENEAGGLLLGLDGTSVIMHGRSSARAYVSGLHVAYRMASASVHRKIAAEIETLETPA